MYDYMAVDVNYDIGKGARNSQLYVSGATIISWIKSAAVGPPVHVTPQRGTPAGTRRDLDGATFTGETAMDTFSTEFATIMRQLIVKRSLSFDSPGMLFK